MEDIEFKTFAKIKEQIGWSFMRRPIGQKWVYLDGFCTNGRGEGFRLHRGMNTKEIEKLIDTLNKRDAEIALLKKKEEDEN